MTPVALRSERVRAAALTLSQAAVLATIFVVAWHRAWKVVPPALKMAGLPNNHLGRTIRVAEVLAILASVLLVVAGPAALSRLRRGATGAFAATALLLAILAGASALWALHPGPPLVQGVHLVIWTAFALVVVAVRLPPRQMVAAFVLGLLVHAAVGFAQVVIQNHVGLTLLGESRIPPNDPLKSVRAGTSSFLRAYGLSPHPNVLAGHLAIGLVLCWGLAVGPRRVGRALVFGAWAVLFVCLLLTFSRSGLIAAVLGMIAAAIWSMRAGELARPVTGLVWKLALTGVLIIAGFSYVFSRYVTIRVMEALLGYDIRLALIHMAMKLIVAHPLVGVGAGNFSLATRAATSGLETYDVVHNVPLLIQAELGLLGLIAAGAIATIIVAVGSRRWRARTANRWHGLVAGSLVALATVSLFDHYLWTHPQGGLLGAWLVGWWLTDESEDASPV